MNSAHKNKQLQDYLPRGVDIPDNARTISISPIIGFLLGYQWSWDRLVRVTNAQNAFYEAEAKLRRTLHNLSTLPEQLEWEHEQARENARNELAAIRYANVMLKEEHERDVARIRAEKESYQNGGKSSGRKHPNEEIIDQDIRAARKEAKRFIERNAYIEPLVRELHEDIDRLLREKVIGEHQASELKRQAEEFIRQKILRL